MNINKKELKNASIILIILSIVMFLFIFRVESNYYSECIAIVILFLMNYFFRNKRNKKIYILINIYIFINIILIYFNIYQANSLGYINGIFNGNVDGVLYYDAAEYYNNILYLNNFTIKEFVIDFIKNLSSGNKMYNIFIYYNLVISKMLGTGIVTLLLIKLNFTIISLNLLSRIADELEIKKHTFAITLFALYPGLLQSNINLLRDNIIMFLIINIIYNCIKYKERKVKSILLIIISGIFLGILRVYSLASLIIAIIIVNKFRNIKKLIQKVLILVLSVIIINQISLKLGYGILGFNYIQLYMNKMSIIEAIFQTLIRLIMGFGVSFEIIKKGILPNILVMLSPLYIIIINSILVICILFRNNKYIYIRRYLLFYFVFSFINGILMVLRDGIIVERIYIMWLWIPCLIISQLKIKGNVNIRNMLT